MSHWEATGALRALILLARETKVRIEVFDADPAWIDAAIELGGEYGEGRTTRWVTLGGVSVNVDMAKRGVAS